MRNLCVVAGANRRTYKPNLRLADPNKAYGIPKR